MVAHGCSRMPTGNLDVPRGTRPLGVRSRHGFGFAPSAMTPERGLDSGLTSCTRGAPCPACLSPWLDH